MFEDGISTADNSMSSPNVPTQSGMTTPSQGAVPDKFSGKSVEDLSRAYTELEKRSSRAEQENKELREFVTRVSPFFKVEGDSVSLNEEVYHKYAALQGMSPGNEQLDNDMNKNQNSNNFMNGNDESGADPISELKKKIEQLESDLREKVDPLQQMVFQDRNEAWIKSVQSEYPDFDQYRQKIGEILNKTGMRISSRDDLKEAYYLAKAKAGGFVDKQQHEQYVGELNKTLQTVLPGAGQPRIDEAKASNRELFGLDSIDKKASAVNQALFGKPMLDG